MTRFFAFFLALVLIAPNPGRADSPVTVFAAASLRGLLEDAAAQDDPADFRFSYGGSGTMARQVAAGAPADAVILASRPWMTWLTDQGGADPDSVRILAANTLVVVGPADAAPLDDPADLPARLGDLRLAMGQRDAVPAGTYARQWLEHADLWSSLQDRLAETDNVRAALALVARGDAPLGIVYASDALAEPAVRVVYEIPAGSHDPIVYLAAALTPRGAAFLDRLRGVAGAQILVRHGFLPVLR